MSETTREAIMREISGEWMIHGAIRHHSLTRWLNMAIDAAKEELRDELERGVKGMTYARRAPQGLAEARPYAQCLNCHRRYYDPEWTDGSLVCECRKAEARRVTCQCREPEAYSNSDLKAIVCNQCGYPMTTEEERAKLPPRAPKRDFGTHICLCMQVVSDDGKTCRNCKGEFHYFDPIPASVMCG